MNNATKATKSSRITMKKVNEAINKAFPHVFLVRHNWPQYFYIASDEDNTSLKIAGMYQTSIHVAQLNTYSVEGWVEQVTALIKQDRNEAWREFFED